jgi:opacity protein-like surface antigen
MRENMKKITTSIVAAFAVSTMAFAGGEIQPVEPVVATAGVDSMSFDRLYVGAGATMVSNSNKYYTTYFDSIYSGKDSLNTTQAMVDVGYKINKYLALEGRYWMGSSKSSTLSYVLDTYDYSAKTSAYGIYVKPMYPITAEMNVYTLAGYGNTKVQGIVLDNVRYSESKSGFQYGAGADYKVTKNISLFSDYVKLNKVTVDSWNQVGGLIVGDITANPYTVNVGVTYSF